MHRIVAFATLVIASLASLGAHADEVADRPTLKGLTSLRVVVDDPGKEAAKVGLTQSALQTDVEARLRKAGLNVLATGERAQGMPYLHLSLNVVPVDGPGDDLFIYSLDLHVGQEVRLIRAPSVRTVTPTWRLPGSLGTVKAAQVTSLRQFAGEYVDRFLAAYQAANKN